MFVVISVDNDTCTIVDLYDYRQSTMSIKKLLELNNSNLMENKICFVEGDNIVTAQDYINDLFEKHTSNIGTSETLLGELVSAISRIGYRYYNDGDKIGVGYGNETCNPAFRFILDKVRDLPDKFSQFHDDFIDFDNMTEAGYENWLQCLFAWLAWYFNENLDSLLNTPNEEPYRLYKNPDYDYEHYLEDEVEETDDEFDEGEFDEDYY